MPARDKACSLPNEPTPSRAIRDSLSIVETPAQYSPHTFAGHGSTDAQTSHARVFGTPFIRRSPHSSRVPA